MKYFWYVIAGVLGGVLGGMGMGGGTLLIPILIIFLNVKQHTAQAINLISFIPMAVVTLIIHIKNKLIDYRKVLWIILPGVITCVGGFFVCKVLAGDVLGRCFGGFLILLSIFQFVTEIKRKPKK